MQTENLPSAGYGSDDGESRIDQMVREKSILQQEITDLRAEYEAEVGLSLSFILYYVPGNVWNSF